MDYSIVAFEGDLMVVVVKCLILDPQNGLFKTKHECLLAITQFRDHHQVESISLLLLPQSLSFNLCPLRTRFPELKSFIVGFLEALMILREE